MSYVSFDDLRSTSLLRLVQDAADDQLAAWSDIARGEIDQFCSRDFLFEAGVTKDVWVTGPLITLAKEISNITAASTTPANGTTPAALDFATQLRVLGPANRQIRYPAMTNLSMPYPIPPRLLTLTADWGLSVPPDAVLRVFRILVDRCAARSHEDDVLQMNAPYSSQDDGDGYNYDLANATLRNLLRPEDRAQLWPHISHGRVVG